MKTHSMSTKTAQVNGRTIDFSVKTVGRLLRLPVDGAAWDQLPRLTKKQHENLFKGEFPQSPKGCQLDKAKQHWRSWLKFVNDYLVFRPQKDTMAQKTIVAAMLTWEGKKINWAQIVQQKMGDKIRMRQLGKPKTLELYSAFYITIYCQELPPLAKVAATPSTSTSTQSPLSSLEKLEGLYAKNYRLKARLQVVQKIANEKQEQLLEKSEALISYQTGNVKNMYDLAQAM